MLQIVVFVSLFCAVVSCDNDNSTAIVLRRLVYNTGTTLADVKTNSYRVDVLGETLMEVNATLNKEMKRLGAYLRHRTYESQEFMNARADEINVNMNDRTEEIKANMYDRTNELQELIDDRTDEISIIHKKVDTLENELHKVSDVLRLIVRSMGSTGKNKTRHKFV